MEVHRFLAGNSCLLYRCHSGFLSCGMSLVGYSCSKWQDTSQVIRKLFFSGLLNAFLKWKYTSQPTLSTVNPCSFSDDGDKHLNRCLFTWQNCFWEKFRIWQHIPPNQVHIQTYFFLYKNLQKGKKKFLSTTRHHYSYLCPHPWALITGERKLWHLKRCIFSPQKAHGYTSAFPVLPQLLAALLPLSLFFIWKLWWWAVPLTWSMWPLSSWIPSCLPWIVSCSLAWVLWVHI